ncbi:MAG TPA: hypothetical protein VGF94_13410 [Kofleriaceae bacterium]|jgi:hypothetical protein
MWQLLVPLVMMAGEYAYHRWIDPPAAMAPPKPQALQIAQTDEGVPIPYCYGTIRVDNPITIWVGNGSAVDGTPFGVPFLYGIDLLWVIAVPPYNTPSFIKRIWWGGTIVDAFDGEHGLFGPGTISSFTVSSGADGVGPFGQIEFYDGSPTQNLGDPSTLAYQMMARSGADMTLCPGYRNQIVVALSLSPTPALGTYGAYLGAVPQIPQISFEVVCANDTNDPSGP